MTGLSSEQILDSRQQHGSNAIEFKEERVLLNVLKEIVLEPMFILLLAACVVYFVAGQTQEGIIMLVSIFIVAGISLFQEYRSRNAIQALKKLSQSRVTVMRSGKEETINIDDVVVDDILLLEEGEIVAADAVLAEARDFSVNESILTGESFAVFKNGSDNIYRGTLVTSGTCSAKVVAVGVKTMFGQIGESVREITVVKTPLQLQIKNFVTKMVWFGAGAFVLVVVINYLKTQDFMHAFMQGLTLAMSVLPEEIPVAFSTFQALGAFRLLKNNIIVKQPQYVETLGAATVICADKTGTVTQNRMSVAGLYPLCKSPLLQSPLLQSQVLEYAMWSSEVKPFDPMEVAIHEMYGKNAEHDQRPDYEQVHEYPIGGVPPMMTHIFQIQNSEEYIIAAKGAVERIISQSKLTPEEISDIDAQSLAYARQGYRVLGVGKGIWQGTQWPKVQDDIEFEFLGLIAFQDPPKDNIKETIQTFHRAGISVKMITGDHKETALAIASQIALQEGTLQEAALAKSPLAKPVLEGAEVVKMSGEQLQQAVKEVNIFARMFPEAKLKVINALKENGEVVAMTGDGVNDAPALKAAHIGIAMGKRGSEVAKGAASLILTDDDLSHMTDAVALGRKIYDNLKKAIQYIVSIHIPIILIVTAPLLMGWAFTDIFSPVHVIFLELIMGPTCSIIYENEPMEAGTMNRPPRPISNTFLSFKQLLTSIAQGLAITIACLGVGYWVQTSSNDESLIRTSIFITLLFSNVFLTLVNRSFYYSVFTTIRYKNNLVPIIIGITLLFIAAVLNVPFLRDLFELHALDLKMTAICAGAAFVGTFWMEIVKTLRPK